MSEEQSNELAPEVIAEAKSLGWAPKEAWKGPEEKWVNADVFLDKAEHVMPILKQHRKQLMQEVGTTKEQLERQAAELKAVRASLKALEESHAEDTAEQVKAAKAELVRGIAEANRDGDHELVAKLTGDLVELQSAPAPAKKPAGDEGADETQGGAPHILPEIKQWYVDNPQYINDPDRRALMNAKAVMARQTGNTKVGVEFMDEIALQVETTLGGQRPRGGKALPGNGGGGRSDSGGGGKSFADLPKEAKEACDKQGLRLVGAGRKFKDQASWRAQYAKTFFEQE